MRSVAGCLLLLGLLHCGSKQDLVIGRPSPVAEGGAPATTGGSAGASLGGASSGAAGAASIAGSPPGGDGPGAAGTAGSGAEDCVSELPVAGLVHRYSFDGSGQVAVDAAADADGDVVGTTLDGSGIVKMDGEGRRYVDLPNGLISSFAQVTIVTWMTWSGGAAYQRIFDFGASSAGEGLGTLGVSYLAVMPMTGFEDQAKPGLGAELMVPGFTTVTLASTEDMHGRFAQVALVLDGGVRASLYIDGKLLASQATSITPADIDDRNNWLGQSQYETDPFFQGNYDELRLYGAALSECQIHTLWVRGPQAL